MIRPTQAVILCGGLGSRLRPFTDNNAKPMAPCNGKPFLWHLINQLHEQGFDDFLLLTGYRSEKIEGYFGNGEEFGWRIKYSTGPVDWDTTRRLWEARSQIDDTSLLMYSDNFATFSFGKLFEVFNKTSSAITFTVHPKIPGNISLDENNLVIKYDNNRNDSSLNYVEIGYMILNKKIMLENIHNIHGNFSIVLQDMSKKGLVSAYIQNDKYYSISDPARWELMDKYLKHKKIILLDRDGVINVKADRGKYITSWKDFEWIQDTKSALKKLSDLGFSFIVISNQAGIARGMLSHDQLDFIHSNLFNQCKIEGINILDIFVCPHHWDDCCDCRKPLPGMFYKASIKYYLRLDKVVFIGDDPRDCQAAYNANCKCMYIGDENELINLKQEEMPFIRSDLISNKLNELIDFYASE